MSALIDNVAIALGLVGLAVWPAQAGEGDLEEATAPLGRVPTKFRECQVVLEPDKDQPEWWAGAPSDRTSRTKSACSVCHGRHRNICSAVAYKN